MLVQHFAQHALPVQNHRDDIHGCECKPNAARKIMHAIHRGEPLMLQRLHPHDRAKCKREREQEDSGVGQETHLVRTFCCAGFILLERPMTEAIRQEPPGRHTNDGDDVETSHREQRLLGMKRVIRVGIVAHPRINFLRTDCQWNKEHRQDAEHGIRKVLASAANRHGPTRVEQMVYDHQKQRTRSDAQDEHERHEIGEQEVHSAALVTDRPAEQSDQESADEQLHGQIAPLGQVQRQRHGRVVGS